MEKNEMNSHLCHCPFLFIQQHLHVCCDGGERWGFKPAQVSLECEIQVAR